MKVSLLGEFRGHGVSGPGWPPIPHCCPTRLVFIRLSARCHLSSMPTSVCQPNATAINPPMIASAGLASRCRRSRTEVTQPGTPGCTPVRSDGSSDFFLSLTLNVHWTVTRSRRLSLQGMATRRGIRPGKNSVLATKPRPALRRRTRHLRSSEIIRRRSTRDCALVRAHGTANCQLGVAG
jgi:hypothetical protein